jgi:hypothetical protein
MSDKPDNAEVPGKELPLPRRPSYEKVAEDLDKWANSKGLQKPVGPKKVPEPPASYRPDVVTR